MPAFAAAFFPRSTAGGGSGSSSSGGSGAAYCMFEDPLLSLGNSIIYLTALPALAAAARLTHARGRKPTMWGIAALQIAGAAAGAAAPNLASVFVSRALLGAAMGCR
jgi:MFS family permease